MTAELLLLGTGASMGIPVIGCPCKVCRSTEPRNRRSRSGALLKVDETRVLIDASQDFREQALLYCIDDVDGVIFTHGHHDHTAGIDDLRIYKKTLPCLMSKETSGDLQLRYAYIFAPKPDSQTLLAKFDVKEFQDKRGTTTFCGLTFKYVTYTQANMEVNGFVFGNLAYISDIKDYPDSLISDIRGVDVLVLSALREGSSNLHFSLDEAVAFAKEVGAQQTWLTHIAHELEIIETNRKLPRAIQLAYDGLRLPFEYGS